MNIIVRYETTVYDHNHENPGPPVKVTGYGRMIDHDFNSGLVLVIDVENGSLHTVYRTSITVTDPELVGGL